jgi:hypothetical protein
VAKRKRQTSVPKKVLEGHRRIWGGRIPAGALAQLKKEYAKNPGRGGFGPKKKSRKRPVGKRAAATRRKVANSRAARTNPPQMKKLTKSTAWMPATAVKIVKRGGKMDVLIRKPAGKKSKRR